MAGLCRKIRSPCFGREVTKALIWQNNRVLLRSQGTTRVSQASARWTSVQVDGGRARQAQPPGCSGSSRYRSHDVGDVHAESGLGTHERGITKGEDSSISPEQPLPSTVRPSRRSPMTGRLTPGPEPFEVGRAADQTVELPDQHAMHMAARYGPNEIFKGGAANGTLIGGDVHVLLEARHLPALRQGNWRHRRSWRLVETGSSRSSWLTLV